MQIHILTKNNQQTILQALESIRACNATKVLVADMGSTDKTIKLCEDWGAQIYRTQHLKRNEARNHLCRMSDQGWKMFVEPWEIMVKGHDLISTQNGATCYATVIQDGFITKEIRFWKVGEFVNPVFERVQTPTTQEVDAVFYSMGNQPSEDILEALKQWKQDHPMAPQPYYFHACQCLAAGKFGEFENLSDHYMALEPNKTCMSAIMNRYYYAMIQIIKHKKLRPALQNLNLCLCARPLMAEFWCLMGDAFYHLANDFKSAKAFYENAIFLGARRLKSDKWPMEIAKYKEYPKKMIENCDNLINHRSTWLR